MRHHTPFLRARRAALLPFAALLLCALFNQARAVTLYRWVDEQGVVHYSDTPHPGAKRIDVHGAQTYSAPRAGAPVTSSAVADKPLAPIAGYDDCIITQPTPNQSFYAPESIHISIKLSPALQAGDKLAVLLDGQPIAGAAGALDYTVSDIDRGTHSITAAVKDGSGQVVCSSPGVTFFVQRPSLLAPNRPH